MASWSDYETLRRNLQIARTQLEQRLVRLDFESSLESFSHSANIGAYQHNIGYRAATSTKAGDHYVHINCDKVPTISTGDDAFSHVWTKLDDQWWTYTPANAVNRTDLKPIAIFFDPKEFLVLQARTGNCMHTQKGSLTQGLTVRNNQGQRWSVTVGHAFELDNATNALNSVAFCPPAAPAAECNFCILNQCNPTCFNLPPQNRSPVCNGVNSIITLNPPPTIYDDLGVYNVPNNVPLHILSVRDVLLQPSIQNLQHNFPNAYAAIGDNMTGMNDVSGEVPPGWVIIVLASLYSDGIFLFKKGATSNWTFAQLHSIQDNQIICTPIGNPSLVGDCGAIWFIVAPSRREAFPIGYHFAATITAGVTLYMHMIPFNSAIETLRNHPDFANAFGGLQFQPLDSYTW